MRFAEFERTIEQIQKQDPDIYVSPDFQCDQTGGFPTSLCVSWTLEKAWLELRYNLANEGDDLSECEQGVADFGIRQCCDAEEFNDLLEELGEDAYDMAYIPPEEEINEMTLGGI